MGESQGRLPHTDDSRIEGLAKRAHENRWGNSDLEEAIKRDFSGSKTETVIAIRKMVQEKMRTLFT